MNRQLFAAACLFVVALGITPDIHAQNTSFEAGIRAADNFGVDATVAGDVGVEWAFEEVPVTIGFDWRPTFRLTNVTDFHSGNWGVTARFRFGAGTFVKAD